MNMFLMNTSAISGTMTVKAPTPSWAKTTEELEEEAKALGQERSDRKVYVNQTQYDEIVAVDPAWRTILSLSSRHPERTPMSYSTLPTPPRATCPAPSSRGSSSTPSSSAPSPLSCGSSGISTCLVYPASHDRRRYLGRVVIMIETIAPVIKRWIVAGNEDKKG